MIKKNKVKDKEKIVKIISLVFLFPVYIIFLIGIFFYSFLIPVPQFFVMKYLKKTKNKDGFLKSYYRAYINNVTGLFNNIFRL
jgi:hypothetical protein